MRAIVQTVWLDFNDDFEGYVRHPYLDVIGLLTTAVGVLIDPIELAHGGEWLTPDGRRASDVEVLTQCRAVKTHAVPLKPEQATVAWWRANRPGEPIPLQLRGGNTPEMRALTTMRLSDAGVVDLCRRKLDDMWRRIAKQFPDAETWPAAAQMGILSVAWARGPNGFASGFPRMTRALRARDFLTASTECGLARGYEDRDAANVALFLEAAQVEADGLDPDVLHYVHTDGGLLAPIVPPDRPVRGDPIRGAIRKAIEDDDDPPDDVA